MPAPRPHRLGVAACLAAMALVAMPAPAWPLAGGLDPTFDDDGLVVTPVGMGSSGNDVVVQADGRIVVVGSTVEPAPMQPTVVRYLTDGGTDASFDDDGIVIPSMEGLAGGSFEGVALGLDGTLVASGQGCVGTDSFVCGQALIARFTSTGDLDPTFGGDGVVTMAHLNAGAARDVAVLGDGRVVAIAGIHVLAFEPDGDPDTTFGGGDGVVDMPNVSMRDLTVDAQGRSVVVGATTTAPWDLWMARFETDGDLDPTFSPGGSDGPGVLRMDLGSDVGVTSSSEVATSVDVDGAGKVVVGGMTQRASDDRNQPFVLRLTAAGVRDTSFGDDGLALNDMPTRPGGVSGLAVLPDGTIAITGGVTHLGENVPGLMAGRFLTDGTPDPSFGGDGIVSYDLPVAEAGGEAFQVDGALLLTGRFVHVSTGELHLGVVRFIGDDPCTQNGTSGPDTLVGTAGPDVLCGLGGNDVLIGKGGDDVLIGGPGMDTASYASAVTAISIDLGAGVGTGQGIDELEGIERITGGPKADRLTGDAAANTLAGGGGADTLNGGKGADALLGGDGKDILNGGAGNDSLNGGPGTDDCNQGGGFGPKTACEP